MVLDKIEEVQYQTEDIPDIKIVEIEDQAPVQYPDYKNRLICFW